MASEPSCDPRLLHAIRVLGSEFLKRFDPVSHTLHVMFVAAVSYAERTVLSQHRQHIPVARAEEHQRLVLRDNSSVALFDDLLADNHVFRNNSSHFLPQKVAPAPQPESPAHPTRAGPGCGSSARVTHTRDQRAWSRSSPAANRSHTAG